MFLVTFVLTGHTGRLHAKNTTKTCKKCNESKTPHIYVDFKVTSSMSEGYLESRAILPKWYQGQYNGNHRQLIHSPQNEIRNIRVCTSVGKDKIIIGYMDFYIKWFPIIYLYSCTYMFSCTDLVHVHTHGGLFTLHSSCHWNSKQQWDKDINKYVIYKFTQIYL
jgi:hypothetical protein